MRRAEQRNGPPDSAEWPNSKRSYEDDVSNNNNTNPDTFRQAEYASEVVLERLREDHLWFRGHAVACENLARALKLGVFSPAKTEQLRQRLTGEADGYCNMGAVYRARYRANEKWGWE